jgi:hypothetical protein
MYTNIYLDVCDPEGSRQMEHVKCIMSHSVVTHRLTVQDMNHCGGWDFQNLCEPAVGSTQLPVQWYRTFPSSKEAGAYHPSNAKFKEQVGLYLFSSSVSSWHVIEWPLSSLEVGKRICISSTMWCSLMTTEIMKLSLHFFDRQNYNAQHAWTFLVVFGVQNLLC